MALKPTVLLYNFTDRRRKNKVNTFCAMHGIRVRTVEKENYEKPVLALVDREAETLFEEMKEQKEGMQKEAQKKGGPDGDGQEAELTDFAEEMLLMCNVGAQMNPFLAWLRKEKIIVPLKAVMTPTNQFWNSLELYAEIRKEHEQMTGQARETDGSV